MATICTSQDREAHQYNIRISKAIDSLRYKSVKSTTLERLRLCVEAEKLFKDLPQPLCMGKTMNYILESIQKPVEPHDLILGRILEEVPDEAGEAFFQEAIRTMGSRPRCMADGGHEGFAWWRLVDLGLPGLETLAVMELEKRKKAGEKKETLDFIEGMILIYRSFRTYARLYGEAAQAAGLDDAAQSCFAAAERAPQTFREALQLSWLVGLVYCTICATNPTLTLGRMDEYLYPFYEKDIESGILTDELAGDLIEDFYCKNNLIMGRGEHQMSYGSEHDTTWDRNLTYDAPQYLTLGGTRKGGAPCDNELTRIFLERVVPRFKNPVIVLRYTDDFPADLWELACSKMSDNASMMVYNDKVVIPSFIAGRIEPDDAITYEMFGCNHPHIPAQQAHGGWGFNALGCLLEVLTNMYEKGHCDDVTMDDIYNRYFDRVRANVVAGCEDHRKKIAAMPGRRPGWLRVDDCFMIGSVENACSWEFGSMKYEGARYYIQFIGSTIDSFAAIDELVFKSKKVKLADLLAALKNDFKDNEPLRQLCLNAPKFGQDDDLVTAHGRRIMNSFYSIINEVTNRDDNSKIIVIGSLETDTGNIGEGLNTGATPDGRHAGQPLSQNAGPTWGASTKGLTAMFQSLAKLPLDRICAGAVNVKVNPGLVRGEKNLKLFSQLLRTYFILGGLQVQLSVTDADELRRAQENPDNYRDLIVRITGYSATFVDMSKPAQNTIIQREEMAC